MWEHSADEGRAADDSSFAHTDQISRKGSPFLFSMFPLYFNFCHGYCISGIKRFQFWKKHWYFLFLFCSELLTYFEHARFFGQAKCYWAWKSAWCNGRETVWFSLSINGCLHHPRNQWCKASLWSPFGPKFWSLSILIANQVWKNYNRNCFNKITAAVSFFSNTLPLFL